TYRSDAHGCTRSDTETFRLSTIPAPSDTTTGEFFFSRLCTQRAESAADERSACRGGDPCRTCLARSRADLQLARRRRQACPRELKTSERRFRANLRRRRSRGRADDAQHGGGRSLPGLRRHHRRALTSARYPAVAGACGCAGRIRIQSPRLFTERR